MRFSGQDTVTDTLKFFFAVPLGFLLAMGCYAAVLHSGWELLHGSTGPGIGWVLCVFPGDWLLRWISPRRWRIDSPRNP